MNFDNELDRPEAPQLLSPADEAVITETNEVTLEWSTAPDAVEYHVEVFDEKDGYSSEEEFRSSVATETDTTSPLSNGWKRWRVEAVNPEGRVSYSSSSRFFVYIGTSITFTDTFGGIAAYSV
ncbi:MAG: hypothetical protein IH971_11070, partial [Candidatus Marinimicrobia bacterium]|nr:hypothetical protein [Candidatus Neomarinimicrobiota bacterium]